MLSHALRPLPMSTSLRAISGWAPLPPLWPGSITITRPARGFPAAGVGDRLGSGLGVGLEVEPGDGLRDRLGDRGVLGAPAEVSTSPVRSAGPSTSAGMTATAASPIRVRRLIGCRRRPAAAGP